MKEKYKISGIDVVICDDKIEHDENRAVIHKVHEDPDYEFDAISCLARPLEFSVVNSLYKLSKEAVIIACEECNETEKPVVLSNGGYHLILNPLIERYTFFGNEESEKLSHQVIDICKKYKIEKLRITQYCLMRGGMPFYDQIKGILSAFCEREDSPVSLMYFDVPDSHFLQMDTLFRSYTLVRK